jgi:hypothetical protein
MIAYKRFASGQIRHSRGDVIRGPSQDGYLRSATLKALFRRLLELQQLLRFLRRPKKPITPKIRAHGKTSAVAIDAETSNHMVG